MREWLSALDRILRGETTRPDTLQDTRIEIPVGGLCVVVLLMAMFHGACVGSFSLFKEIDPSVVSSGDRYRQMFATTIKVPVLFCLTLLITFPSLYVFNALVGSRLNLSSLFRLLMAALCVNLAVLASFGTIVAFFSVSTTNYPFMVLFNVLVFSLAGVLGLVFLTQTLNRLSQSTWRRERVQSRQEPIPPDGLVGEEVDVPPFDGGGSEVDEAAGKNENPTDELLATFAEADRDDLGALDLPVGHVLGKHVKTVIRIWMVVFALVGAQMGWVLRPFIGDPKTPFEWIRQRDSNFFEGVWRTITSLLTGSG